MKNLIAAFLFLIATASLVQVQAQTQTEKTLGPVVLKERSFDVKIEDCEKSFIVNPAAGVFPNAGVGVCEVTFPMANELFIREVSSTVLNVDLAKDLPAAKPLGINLVNLMVLHNGYRLYLMSESFPTGQSFQDKMKFETMRPLIKDLILLIPQQKARIRYTAVETGRN